MRSQFVFSLTLFVALAFAWLTSGQRFLDWVFGMPDLWLVDDFLIGFAVAADEWKAELGVPDLFGETRAWLHRNLGLSE